MTSNARCSTLQLAVLAIATIWLSGCATGASDVVRPVACLPVAEYSREFEAQAAKELVLLPEGSAIMEMLADYAMMRDQARACQSTRTKARAT